eukprot:1534125-Pleurochrysis_carterae.AAC.5
MAKAQILTAQLRLLLLFYAVTTAVARDSLPMLSSRHTLTSRNGRSGVDGFSDPLLEPLERWQPSLPSMRLGSGRGGSLTSRAELLAARRNADKGSTSLAYKRAIWATIWSFVATAVFGVAVILPLKASRHTCGLLLHHRLRPRLAGCNCHIGHGDVDSEVDWPLRCYDFAVGLAHFCARTSRKLIFAPVPVQSRRAKSSLLVGWLPGWRWLHELLYGFPRGEEPLGRQSVCVPHAL